MPVGYPAPVGFFEDTNTIVPITLLGAADGFNFNDANGNPYARFTWNNIVDLNWRHYAMVATTGLTYGFNIKITF